jgi:uroporphyrinogen decarboxylase
MTEMTKKERVRAALAGKPVDRPPFALWGHDFLREWSPEELVAATLDAYGADNHDFIKLNPRSACRGSRRP